MQYQIGGIGSGGDTNTDQYSHQNYGSTPLSLAYTGSVRGVGHAPVGVFSGTSLSTINVSAFAGPGILRVAASGIANATSSTVSSDGQDQVSTSLADTTAVFSDMITINSRYQGVSMTVKGSYTVAGSIATEASSDPYPEKHLASSSVNVLLGGTGIAASASVVGSAGTPSAQTPVDVNQDLFTVVPVSFAVTAGTPTLLLSQLMMDSSTIADISGGLVQDPSSGAYLPAPIVRYRHELRCRFLAHRPLGRDQQRDLHARRYGGARLVGFVRIGVQLRESGGRRHARTNSRGPAAVRAGRRGGEATPN